ncbi:MAG: type secretion system protein GspG [Planctomycetota bacterium]|jgi:general secretion pathway protein G
MSSPRSARRRLQPRRGFSLLEVIIAVTIVALLATLVVPRLIRFLAGANEDKAVAEVNSLANTVKLYIAEQTTGTLTDDFSLDMLVEGENPFLNSPEELIDPWGNAYDIVIPGDRNIDFDIVCYGPDGKPGGGDDIVHGKR